MNCMRTNRDVTQQSMQLSAAYFADCGETIG